MTRRACEALAKEEIAEDRERWRVSAKEARRRGGARGEAARGKTLSLRRDSRNSYSCLTTLATQ